MKRLGSLLLLCLVALISLGAGLQGIDLTSTNSGVSTSTAHAILIGEGATSPLAGVGPCATSGQVIVGQGASADPACGSIRQIISSTITAGLVQNTTDYVGMQGGLSSTQIQALAVPIAGTLKNMVLNVGNAPAAGQTVTATLYTGTFAQAVAGTMSASTVTCQITSAATQCTDGTHSVAIAAGNVFNWQIVTSATSGTITGLAYSVEFDNP